MKQKMKQHFLLYYPTALERCRVYLPLSPDLQLLRFITALAFSLIFLFSCSYFFRTLILYLLITIEYFCLSFYLLITPQSNLFHRLQVFLRLERNFCLPYKFSFIPEAVQRPIFVYKLLLSTVFSDDAWVLGTVC